MDSASQRSAVGTAVAVRPAASRKAAPLIFLLCLLVAVAAVLFVPMFVSGASVGASSVSAAATVQLQQEESFQDLASAAQALGFTPLVPQQLPEGYALSGIRALSGGVLEMEYAQGKNVLLFRTAPGADDLSDDTSTYAFTATEKNGETARSYAGQSEQKLNLAVWAQGEASYSIQAAMGLPAADMRAMAESVA